MAGYYDANKDYSKAISEAKAAGKDTTQLEMERQNKIDDKYGGKEPNMIGSDKTFSQLSGGSSSSGSNATMGGSSSKITSGIGSSNTNRNTALAGQSVKDGQYTVTYDDRGYIVKTVKDGGASATSTVKTTHADDSANHRLAYQAAQAGDWDSVGRYINQIGMSGGKDQYGNYDMGAANSYLKELTDEFQYNAKDYYDKLYDQAYGEGSSAVFDATGGSIKTYQGLVDAVGAQEARKYLDQQSGATGTSFSGIQTGGTPVILDTAGMNIYGSDAYQYIRDMYAQNQAAQLAQLKSTYEQNMADAEAQDDIISNAYQQQKNQAAAQNDLQRMQMNEYGITRGLNTGASGQMALAQSAAYQGALAQLGTQEAQSLADNALSREKLTIAYRNAIDQAEAEGNYQLASALYQEYVRQDELARQEAAAAQEQANWEAEMAYKANSSNRDYAYGTAMNSIKSGYVPDSATLEAAGLSVIDATNMANYYKNQIALDTAYQNAQINAKKNNNLTGKNVENDAVPVTDDTGRITDISSLDSNQFTNQQKNDMVLVQRSNGSPVWMSWYGANQLLGSGKVQAVYAGNGKYTLTM